MFPSSIYSLVYFVRTGEAIRLNGGKYEYFSDRDGFIWKDPEHGIIDPTIYDTEQQAYDMLIRAVREKKARALGRR